MLLPTASRVQAALHHSSSSLPTPSANRQAPMPLARHHKLAALHTRLKRLAATPSPQQTSFVSEDEQRRFTPEQLEFLERKRQAAAGLGPVMPEACTCQSCFGSGSLACHQCNGTGVNAVDKAAELFQNERGIVKQNNQSINTEWFFKEDCPCWLCRGSARISCADCGGSGLSGMSGFVAD